MNVFHTKEDIPLNKINVLLVLSTMVTLSACVSIGNDYVEKNNYAPGQALIDLHKAKELGIISEKEYADSKKTILNKI